MNVPVALPVRQPPLAAAARAYSAQLGWPVLPLVPCGKVPVIGKSEGGRGVHDATLDVDWIAEWFSRWPNANIGIACGAVSGIVAVDVDGETGLATLADLERLHGSLPRTPRQHTGAGGLHLVFGYDAAQPIGNRVRRLPGIDTRSDGGYVVACPSVHPVTRQQYRWDPELHPTKLAPAVMPDWLAELLAPPASREQASPTRPFIEESVGWGPHPRYSRAALERACTAIETAQVGEQERTLSREAYSIGRLIGAGLMPRRLAIDCLVYAGGLMLDAPGRRPWCEREIRWRVERAVRAGECRPREVVR